MLESRQYFGCTRDIQGVYNNKGKFTIIKSSIFRDVTPCSSLKVNQRFGGTCRLYLQRRRISQARNQHEAGKKPA
jgi:hypothetical protein